ncbi:MAG TPA: 4-hydroxybenzoate octaprenyltransferase [Burkholderiales bacterium]|nr:4-hydroxybenzoate octaprenyltransferase [Burkholderiales bacterium]
MRLRAIADRITLYERLMRLDKPIGTLLLLWPTLWALWFASAGRPDAWIVWIFMLGTLLMRSAGCVMNDIADWRYDAKVKRTRERPLAAGALGRGEALVLAALLSLAAFGLVLTLDRLAIILSFAALGLAATYPLTKRFLALPQAYLGIAFGFGIPMGYAAVLGIVPAVAWMLLLANIFWAVAYDTEYAMVDRDDDVRIGIKTAAITFGRFDVAAVMICYAATLAVLAGIGTHYRMGPLYYGGLAVAGALMLHHYRLVRTRDRDACFKAFNQNNWVGAVVFAGIFADFATKGLYPWISV